jgi:hypothetical protein
MRILRGEDNIPLREPPNLPALRPGKEPLNPFRTAGIAQNSPVSRFKPGFLDTSKLMLGCTKISRVENPCLGRIHAQTWKNHP